MIDISIHSLPKEGDPPKIRMECNDYISIHSLPKEGDSLVKIAFSPNF